MALTRAQNYPKITMRPDQGLEIEDRVYAAGVSYSDFVAQLPDLGEQMSDIETTAKLIKYGPVFREATNDYWYADLLYATPSVAYVFSMEQSPTDLPIEKKTGFKTQWKYALAGVDITAAEPAWYATATTQVIASPDEQSWRWISEAAELPTETDGTRWGVKSWRTKPGLDSFLVGSIVIKSQGWYTTFEDANDAAAAFVGIVGTRVVPTTRFGYPDTVANWLCVGMDVAPDGYYHTLTLRYQWSDEGWDPDLYDNFA